MMKFYQYCEDPCGAMLVDEFYASSLDDAELHCPDICDSCPFICSECAGPRTIPETDLDAYNKHLI